MFKIMLAKFNEPFKIFKNKYLYLTFLIDLIFFGFSFLVIILFSNFLKAKTKLLGDYPSTEYLNQLLISNSAFAQSYLSNLKSFMFFAVFGSIVLLVALFLICSLSRAKIWYLLLKKKLTKHNYWKWNLLNLVILILSLVYLLIILILNGLFLMLLQLIGNQIILDVFSFLFNTLIIILYLIFLFLVYHTFAIKYKVWESIGEMFNLISKKWKKLMVLILYSLIIITLITIILYFINNPLINYSTVILIVNGLLFLFFLAWFRIYLMKTIGEKL